MTKEELNYIKDAFSQIIDDIGDNPDWYEAARSVASDLGTLERKLEEKVSSLPSNLDEAAEEYAYRGIPDIMKPTFKPLADEVAKYFKAGAEWMQNKMFSLRFENEPLDSAARKVFEDWIPMEVLTIDGGNGGIPLYNQGALIMMFDAGAKWMAGQGEMVEGEIVCAVAHPHENKVIARVYGDYKFGDKVIVQIRKK